MVAQRCLGFRDANRIRQHETCCLMRLKADNEEVSRQALGFTDKVSGFPGAICQPAGFSSEERGAAGAEPTGCKKNLLPRLSRVGTPMLKVGPSLLRDLAYTFSMQPEFLASPWPCLPKT